jgi:hypothetical protein
MDFTLSEEENMLRDSVARFTAAEYELTKRNKLIAENRDHWATFAELGWLGVGIPEEAGGYGGDLNGVMVIAEALGAGLALEPFLGAAVLAPQTILAALGPEASGELLAPVVEGAAQIALANNEYEALGNLSFCAASARAVGDGYELSGAKSAVLGGATATSFLVAARTSGTAHDKAGISLFLLPRDTPGLTVRAYRLMDATPVADLVLNKVNAPKNTIIGPIGGAYAALEAGTDIAIVAASFGAVGAMDSALQMTVEYLKTRNQYGAPLRDLQVLRHRAADMLVALEQARSAAYRSLAGLHENDPNARARAASTAKIVAAKSSHFVCGQAIQLHGGMGVTEELRIGHLFKYITANNALLGSASYHVGRMGALL